MVSSIFFSVEILSDSLKVVFTRFRTLSHDQARLVCAASLLTGGDRGIPTRWDCVQYLFACLPPHVENSKQHFLGLKFFRFFKIFYHQASSTSRTTTILNIDRMSWFNWSFNLSLLYMNISLSCYKTWFKLLTLYSLSTALLDFFLDTIHSSGMSFLSHILFGNNFVHA